MTGPPCHWGLDARLKPLFFEKISVEKSEEVKTGCNLAELFKEGYCSTRAVLPTMMMMMTMMISYCYFMYPPWLPRE
jgi:hypothetical protein